MSPRVAEPPQLSPPIDAPLALAVIVVVALPVQIHVGEVAKLHRVESTLIDGGKSRWVQAPSRPASRAASLPSPDPESAAAVPMQAPSWHVDPPGHMSPAPQP